uniref:Putative caspase n=1 Tax=Corethrella appendiculata TaxID=1370023 RepID=U5EH80_9DIPT
MDIFQMLTNINRRVAYEQETNSNFNRDSTFKQMPIFESMLTANLQFEPNESYSKDENSAQTYTWSDGISKEYEMDNNRRGKAMLFNQLNFNDSSPSTNTECIEKLEKTLIDFGFETTIYTDLKRDEIMSVLFKMASENHSDADCFMVVFSTHGNETMLKVKDGELPVNHVFAPFYGDNCETLIGKPKLFFINACRGEKTDCGTENTHNNIAEQMQNCSLTNTSDEVDAKAATSIKKQMAVSIPISADVLKMYSSPAGYKSYATGTEAIFLKYLNEGLRKCLTDENQKQHDILQVLTNISYDVATNFESYGKAFEDDAKKTIPVMSSSLTKTLYLKPKWFLIRL